LKFRKISQKVTKFQIFSKNPEISEKKCNFPTIRRHTSLTPLTSLPARSET
jgi:hypothetical protein